MCMGFKDPVHDQRMVAHEREHAVGRGGRGAGTGGIVVEHRVDDGGLATVTIVDHVGEGERGRVVKALDLRIHLTAPCLVISIFLIYILHLSFSSTYYNTTTKTR